MVSKLRRQKMLPNHNQEIESELIGRILWDKCTICNHDFQSSFLRNTGPNLSDPSNKGS